jgi:hypothetical protein
MNIEEEKGQLECLKSKGKFLFSGEHVESDKTLLNVNVSMNKRIHLCKVSLSARQLIRV